MAINYRQQYLRYNRYFRQLTDTYAKIPAFRTGLELLLTLFTISFFLIFALRPTANTITELWANLNSQKEIKTRLEQKIRDLSSAQKVWEAEQKKLELVEEALPQKPNPDTYIKQVENLAATRGLSINFLSVDRVMLRGEIQKEGQQEEKGKARIPGLETVGSSLSLSGQYSGLLGFLEDLEKLRRVVKTLSLSFSTTRGAASGEATLLLTIASEVAYHKSTKTR